MRTTQRIAMDGKVTECEHRTYNNSGDKLDAVELVVYNYPGSVTIVFESIAALVQIKAALDAAYGAVLDSQGCCDEAFRVREAPQ